MHAWREPYFEMTWEKRQEEMEQPYRHLEGEVSIQSLQGRARKSGGWSRVVGDRS